MQLSRVAPPMWMRMSCTGSGVMLRPQDKQPPCLTTPADDALTNPLHHLTSPRHDLTTAHPAPRIAATPHHGSIRHQRCAIRVRAQLSQTSAREALDRQRAAVRRLQAYRPGRICAQQPRNRHSNRQWYTPRPLRCLEAWLTDPRLVSRPRGMVFRCETAVIGTAKHGAIQRPQAQPHLYLCRRRRLL